MQNTPAEIAGNVPGAQGERTATFDLDTLAGAHGSTQDPVLLKAVQNRLKIQGNSTEKTESAAKNLSLTQAVSNSSPEGRNNHAASDNPFQGKDLRVVTAELATHKFVGNTPIEWGEHIPGVTYLLSHVWEKRGHPPTQHYSANPLHTAKAAPEAALTVALTFVACEGRGGRAYDQDLIRFLREHSIPATFFVSSAWMKNNRAVLQNLSKDVLFEIAAHGAQCKPASIDGRKVNGVQGPNSLLALVQEVEGNVREIEALTGKRPRWYRSGFGYYDDVAIAVIRALGLGAAGSSINLKDLDTFSTNAVVKSLSSIQDGDIIAIPFDKPTSGIAAGLAQITEGLKERGIVFSKLSD